MIVGDLFSGIGGFSLAARWMGWTTAWFSEIDAACSGWLAEHWPGVPNHGDITQIDFTRVAPVDLLCGGFPCQPHSQAGKRKGSADERDLWPEYERAIRLLRPRYVVAENVPGLFASDGGRFFGRVLGALAALGYDAEWTCLSGADVGAPHERERVWLVAYPERAGLERRGDAGDVASSAGGDEGEGLQRERGRGAAGDCGAGIRAVADADDAGRGEQRRALAIRPEQSAAQYGGRELGDADPERRGEAGRLRLDSLAGAGGAGEGLGDPESEPEWTGLRAGQPRGERRGRPGDANRQVVAWHDAVPVRGADGVIRLVPREAAETGPESPLWPVAHGLPGRVARLRAIGNAIIPQCAYEIFRAIEAAGA